MLEIIAKMNTSSKCNIDILKLPQIVKIITDSFYSSNYIIHKDIKDYSYGYW